MSKPRSPVFISDALSVDADGSLYELDALTALGGGDPVASARLIDGLIQSNRIDLEELEAVVEAKDFTGLADIAHRLTGPARIIKAQPLLVLCSAIEEACRNEDVTVMQAKSQLLHDLIHKMEMSLLEDRHRLVSG